MRKPLVLSIMIQNHLLFELLLCFVLILMHNEFDFKRVNRQKIVIGVNYFLHLVFIEMGKKIYNEFFVIL